jgi:hypothetical protein
MKKGRVVVVMLGSAAVLAIAGFAVGDRPNLRLPGPPPFVSRRHGRISYRKSKRL